MAKDVKKDVATAVLLNLFFPGVGYLYAGRIVIGIFVLFLIAGAFLLGAMGGVLGVMAITAPVIGFLGVVGAVDGYLATSKHNRLVDQRLQTREAQTMMRCPECAESIRRDAHLCRYCQTRLVA